MHVLEAVEKEIGPGDFCRLIESCRVKAGENADDKATLDRAIENRAAPDRIRQFPDPRVRYVAGYAR